MRFIDLDVHSIYSTGVDTPLRLAHHARELGIEIGLCDSNRDQAAIPHVNGKGCEIFPKAKREFRDRLRSLRGEWDYVVVPGGSDVANRLAVGDDRVSILVHPDLGRRDSGLDSFLAREAKANGVAVGINLGGIIAGKGSQRINLCRNALKNLKLARKYGFDLIACTGARSRFDLRGADCTYELLLRIGFTDEEAARAMYDVPAAIMEGSR